MSNLPQSNSHPLRPTRVRPAEYTPAVLRIEDGSCTQATLELFSLTGGLLSLPKPLDLGSRPRLMFLTQTGPVLGVAEMLRPVSWTEQPFRFVGLQEDDQKRLRVATQTPAEEKTAVAAAVVKEAAVKEAAAKEVKRLALSSTLPPESVPAFDTGEAWITKFRAAIDEDPDSAGRLPRIFAAVTAASVALGVLAYMVQTHLMR